MSLCFLMAAGILVLLIMTYKENLKAKYPIDKANCINIS